MRTTTLTYLFGMIILLTACNNEFGRYFYACNWVKFEREGKITDDNTSQIAGRIMTNSSFEVEQLQIVFFASGSSVTQDTFSIKPDGSFEGWLSNYDTYFDVQVIGKDNLLCEATSPKIQRSSRYWCILRLDKQKKKRGNVASSNNF